jgi:hypothetical protein
MADEPETRDELTEDELEAENGEELPDRETMMILDPGPGPLPAASDLEPIPWSDGENPDDRYEQ